MVLQCCEVITLTHLILTWSMRTCKWRNYSIYLLIYSFFWVYSISAELSRHHADNSDVGSCWEMPWTQFTSSGNTTRTICAVMKNGKRYGSNVISRSTKLNLEMPQLPINLISQQLLQHCINFKTSRQSARLATLSWLTSWLPNSTAASTSLAWTSCLWLSVCWRGQCSSMT